MTGAYAGASPERVRSTLAYLRGCVRLRDSGARVGFVTDPWWALDMAINRKAGWPDDPSLSRGSARPLPDGRYPPKASGDAWRHLRQLADRINRPRLIVRASELGEWRALLTRRLTARFS